MKLAKFIHPLFWLALGVHTLVLFIPTGNSADKAVPVEPAADPAIGSDPLQTPTGKSALVPLGDGSNSSSLLPASPAPSLLIPEQPSQIGGQISGTRFPQSVAIRPATGGSASYSIAGQTTGTPQTVSVPAARSVGNPPGNLSGSPSGNPSGNLSANQETQATNPPSPNAATSTSGQQTQEGLPILGGFSGSESVSGPTSAPALANQPNQAINPPEPQNPAQRQAQTGTGNPAGNVSENPEAARPSVRDLIAQAQGEVPEPLKALVAAFRNALAYEPKDTDEASAQRNRQAWESGLATASQTGDRSIGFGRSREQDQQFSMPVVVSELAPIRYPIDAAGSAERIADSIQGRSLSRCLTPEPRNAQVGLQFDAQGQLVGEPQILRSTGYKALNDEIMAAFTQEEPLTAASSDLSLDNRRAKAFLLEVEVNYDAESCVSLEALIPKAKTKR